MTYFVISLVLLVLLIAALAGMSALATCRTRNAAAAKRRAIAREQAEGEARATQVMQDTVDQMFRAVREQQQ